MSVAEVEQEIEAAGAALVWVLEAGRRFQPGTAALCRETVDALGSTAGWCVGDSQTEPTPGTFDDSPFSQGRGFDILVPRASMRIAFSTNHGTPSGNENLDGPGVLARVREVLEGL